MIVDGVSLLVVVVDMRGDLQMCVGPHASCVFDRRPLVAHDLWESQQRRYSFYSLLFSVVHNFVFLHDVTLLTYLQHTLVDNRYLPRTTMS